MARYGWCLPTGQLSLPYPVLIQPRAVLTMPHTSAPTSPCSSLLPMRTPCWLSTQWLWRRYLQALSSGARGEAKWFWSLSLHWYEWILGTNTPSLPTPSTTPRERHRKSKTKAKKKAKNNSVTKFTNYQRLESRLFRYQLKAEKLTLHPCHISRKHSNVQAANVKLSEFQVWGILRRNAD